MTNSSLLRSLVGGAAVLAIAAWAPSASASAFQLVEQNGSGLGNAYSGQAAVAEDASTIFFNPAGMTNLPARQLSLGGTLVRPITKFEDGGSRPGQLAPGLVLPGTNLGGNGGDAGSLSAVPNGYLSWEVAPQRVWAGLGVSTPFGLVTEWDDGWVGRFHALKSDVKTVNINPSVAVKVNEWVSLGAGFNAQWIDAELSNAVNYSGIVFGQAFQAARTAGASPAQAQAAAAQATAGALGSCSGASAGGFGCEGVGTVKGNSWNWGWNVGAMLSLPTKTRIGASYRSAIKHEIDGTVTFTNRPAALANAVPDGDIKTTIKLPDTASFAVAQQLGDLQLLADFTWTGWSTLQDLSIFRASGTGLSSTPLKFRNSWRAGVGANYQLLPAVKVRGGVAYDESPVRDEFRTPRLPDQDRLWLATGAQVAVTKAAAVDLGFAWLFVSEGRSQLGQPAPTAQFPVQAPRGTLVGHYVDTNVWILGV